MMSRSRSVRLGGGLLAVMVAVACGDDASTGGADTTATETTAASTTGGTADDTASPPMLDDPYGACAGSMATTECVDAGPDVAVCIERDGPGGAYSTCAVLCMEDADCPPIGAGNIPPECLGATADAPGRCLVDCPTGGANSCASGTVCIDGDPPLCMWPQEIVGHPDEQSFCDTACGVCGATALLPWQGDCVAGCLGDLADCSESERDEVFACTGGEMCPVGGAVVADCVEGIACVQGAG